MRQKKENKAYTLKRRYFEDRIGKDLITLALEISIMLSQAKEYLRPPEPEEVKVNSPPEPVEEIQSCWLFYFGPVMLILHF